MILLFMLCFSFVCAFGQLQGRFNYGQDGRIYFYLSNPTNYQIPVFWGAYNQIKNQQIQNQGIMSPGGTFIFGPNTNWTWEKGEKFAVTYSNDQTAYWICPETDPIVRNRSNPSFGSGRVAVSVRVSGCRGFGGSVCSCKVYKGYRRAGTNIYEGSCTNYAGGHQCGHGPSAHGL